MASNGGGPHAARADRSSAATRRTVERSVRGPGAHPGEGTVGEFRAGSRGHREIEPPARGAGLVVVDVEALIEVVACVEHVGRDHGGGVPAGRSQALRERDQGVGNPDTAIVVHAVSERREAARASTRRTRRARAERTQRGLIEAGEELGPARAAVVAHGLGVQRRQEVGDPRIQRGQREKGLVAQARDNPPLSHLDGDLASSCVSRCRCPGGHTRRGPRGAPSLLRPWRTPSRRLAPLPRERSVQMLSRAHYAAVVVDRAVVIATRTFGVELAAPTESVGEQLPYTVKGCSAVGLWRVQHVLQCCQITPNWCRRSAGRAVVLLGPEVAG
jgi:hypothetical protein